MFFAFNQLQQMTDENVWDTMSVIGSGHPHTRRKRRGIYRISNPRALLRHQGKDGPHLKQSFKKVEENSLRDMPSWTNEKSLTNLDVEYLRSLGETKIFPTTSTSHKRRSFSRRAPQVYVFPDFDSQNSEINFSNKNNILTKPTRITTTRKPFLTKVYMYRYIILRRSASERNRPEEVLVPFV